MSCIFQLCVVRSSSRSDYCESRAHPGGGGAFALIKAKTIDDVNNARAKKTKSHGQQNIQKNDELQFSPGKICALVDDTILSNILQ